MVMKKLLIFALMVVVLAACKQQTREQIAQKLGDAMIKKVEKNVNQRIGGMLTGMLENPDSYEPLSTDMAIVMNNMVLYDSQAFVAMRDMRSHISQYRNTFHGDTTSAAARAEVEVIANMMWVLVDRLNAIERRPVEFEAIDAYHQFNVLSKRGKKVKRGYHFIIHRDNRITLLCDDEEFNQVQAFADSLLNGKIKIIPDNG